MMTEDVEFTEIKRLLVVMPSWLGDCVMASPSVRALRELYPAAQITALIKQSVRPVIDAMPWFDRVITIRQRNGVFGGLRKNLFTYARSLSHREFDMAILLPNSFRVALFATMAGIPRRVGYDRDGRGFLLTDRLLPLRKPGGFIPVPTLEYYLGIVRYLGKTDPSTKMTLFTRSEEDRRVDELLGRGGYDINSDRLLVIMNPGANFGSAKVWPAERFAQVADRCIDELDCVVAVSGSPKERPIIDRVLANARNKLIDLSLLGLNLKLLKSVIKRCDLLITNDTGPRHIAAAFNRPVVTIFGPTDPAWTEIHFDKERQVNVDVFCGPCQKKRCPLRRTENEMICMTGITADMVFEKTCELIQQLKVST